MRSDIYSNHPVIQKSTIYSVEYFESAYLYKVLMKSGEIILVSEREDNIDELKDMLKEHTIVLYKGIEDEGVIVVDDISIIGRTLD